MNQTRYLKKIQRFERGSDEEGCLYVVTDPCDIYDANGTGIAFVFYSDMSKKDAQQSLYLDGVKYVLE